MAKALMLIITIVCIVYIVYNFIKDKPILNIFFALIIQSILLFLILSLIHISEPTRPY